MSKKINAVMGRRIEDVLSGKPDPNLIYARLLMGVNLGTCITEQQKAQITEGVGYIEKLVIAQDIIGRNRVFTSIQIMTTTINSFRLDCENCLNAECQHRDPEHPINVTHIKKGGGKKDKK